MAVIDDEFLSRALHEAGDAFAVPASGADDILQRVRNADASASNGPTQTSFALGDVSETQTARHRLRTSVRAHRLLSAAAAVLIVVAVIGGSALLTGHPTPKPSGFQAGSATGTTVPVQHQALAPATGSLNQNQDKTANGAVPAPTFSAGPTPSAGVPASVGSTGAASSGGSSTGTGSAPAITPTTIPTGNGTVGQPARIQQTGSLDLQVAKGGLQRAIGKLTFLAAEYNGFVVNSQSELGAGPGSVTGSVTLQVPVDSFSAVLKSAQSFGKTVLVSTKATDVTAQYVDLQAQISALEAARQQYLTIMSRASTIGDVLAVQSQLDNLQTQIQQLQGQLNVLSSETTYSTLNVLLSESTTFHRHPAPQPESGWSKAWHDSVHGFAQGVEGLIRVAGPILFALLLAGIVVVAGRLLWRRYQRHRL
ncbi:MAG TPA: DUF4349 domain-containing protein [Acidimicrobiales bacterium]|nr:DUF4349 domain-containing protein [Acidimicrobiales bacterium]